MLIPLKYKATTAWCVGGNPLTIIINDDPMCRQPVHPKDDIKLGHAYDPKVHGEENP